MMHSISTLIGASVLAGVGYIATIPVFNSKQPFMEVIDVRYEGGKVIAIREVLVAKMVADWRVTVVGERRDAPYCQTTPGIALNKGWSKYERAEPTQQVMELDVWVGDETGCLDRLTVGNYSMFMTWTPHDGGTPVYSSIQFRIEDTPTWTDN